MKTSPTSSGILTHALLPCLLAACAAGSETPEIHVAVDPTTAQVDVGGTAAFASAVTGTLSTDVVWSVPGTSGCGSIARSAANSALYSAPMSLPLAPAICLVVATSVADSTKSATATVTLVNPGPPPALAIAPNPVTVPLGGTQQFTVTPAGTVAWDVVEIAGGSSAAAYPLRVSANGRYLVDQNGRPWRIQADAAWLMSANATPAEVDTYLSTRKAQGFNSFYLMAMVHQIGYGTAPRAPNNVSGDPPFATPGNFATAGTSAASERYWAWIDTIIDKAAAQGMVVMLAYTYLGYQSGPQGWYAEMTSAANTRQVCLDWGTWLGNRYKNRPNVIWFALGDYTPPAGSEGEARTLAIINGIKAAGATQLFMAEPSGGDANPILDAPAFASVLDLNSFYGYGPNGRGDCYGQAERSYRATPAKPVWVQEGGYEFENNTGSFTGQSYETRRTRFWSVLAGGTAGDGFGTRDVYQWLGLPGSLSTPGATYSTRAFEFLASLAWWDLRPSGTGIGFAGRTLITAGGGTRGATDWVTSAVTGDGTTLLAYIPTTGETGSRTLTVDMAAMSGLVQARWWDPATGAYVTIAPDLPNSGTRSFTSPGANGGGQNDWVLRLDSSVGSPRCGVISSSGLYTAPASVPAGVTCRVTATGSGPNVVAYVDLTVR